MAKVALLIGVSEYEAELAPLPNAVNDVEAMRRVLVNPEMGGFAEADVIVLKNPQRQEMEDAIYHLYANRQKDDLLLFYYSGHGVRVEDGDFYFSTSITRKHQGRLIPSSAVAARDVHRYMNQSKSKRLVVILDCNFSGAFANSSTGNKYNNIAILSSSTSTQYAFESDNLDLSIYTNYLVEGIETGAADQNGDGRITVDELHQYVKRKVQQASPAMTPEFYPYKEGYNVYLAKSPKDNPSLKYRKEVEKITLEDEGDISVVNRFYLDEFRNSLRLSADIADAIEFEVLEPHSQRQQKLQRYEQALSQLVQKQYPLSDKDRNALKRLQNILNLRDEDVVAIESQNRTLQSNIRILFLTTDPSDTSRLRLQQELRDIQEHLKETKKLDRFALELRYSVRLADITKAILDFEPQIVHFSGHGTSAGELCFEDSLGNVQPVASQALKALFKLVSDKINCVVLNACYSTVQATAIAEYIPFVIGLNQALGNVAEIAFAVGFYKALSAGGTIEEAYKFGCAEIRLQGISEHLAPILHTKREGQHLVLNESGKVPNERILQRKLLQQQHVSLSQMLSDIEENLLFETSILAKFRLQREIEKIRDEIYLVSEQLTLLDQLEKLYKDEGYIQEYIRNDIEENVFYSISLNILPKVIQVGGEIEISINLKQFEASNENDYMLQIPKSEVVGSELNIILIAPGFLFEGDNTTSLPFDSELYSDISIQQTIQTARFRLTALRPGNATITAELYRGDTFETKLETQIQVTDIDEATFTPQRITTQPRPVPQPDFILRIQTIWNESNSTCKFQYQLKRFRFTSVFTENNIYTSDSLSSNWLEQTRGLLATTLENITDSLPSEGKSRLVSLGQYLCGHLFPTELQSDFSSLIPQNSTFTLLILADQEAWIPWELLYDGQRFLGDRFIIGRWLQELNNTRPYEFPVGAVNVAHYANVEQPQLWATLLEAPGAPPPQPLPAGVLHDSTEAIRGLHLIRYSQSSDADLRNAPVTLDNINDTEDIELQMRPAKLNLRRNRPFVTLSYVKTDIPELTALENTWASAFIRAGCSGFTGSLWAVESSVEAAFISGFYNRLWAGASLSEAFYTSRQLARAAAPDSLDWLAYVLFGDPMARPYRPVPGDGYAIVEPIGREIDDPLSPGAIARFRVTLRRNPPVWHEDRVIEVAENLVFENLQVHIVTYGLQVIPDLPITMTLTAKGDYLGWFTLVVPNEITDTSALVQVYFADGMRPIHSLNFSLKIENGREE